MNKLSNHIKAHKGLYGLVVVVVLLVVGALSYTRPPNFDDVTAELAGEVGKVAQEKLVTVEEVKLDEVTGQLRVSWRVNKDVLPGLRLGLNEVKVDIYSLALDGSKYLFAKDVSPEEGFAEAKMPEVSEFRIGIAVYRGKSGPFKQPFELSITDSLKREAL